MAVKDFPRIYSLSTVGIRNHHNTDYRFHPFRTDFTGDSGIGKTMIADILQLILVGERDFKSATEANADRLPRKLILQRYGYVFMNIEVAPNHYLVIGMFISSSSIDPFIIQQGFNWEEYTPISNPISYRRMLFNDNILDIDTLCDKLTDLHCKKFSLKRYHEILLNYKILPIDLRNEKELKNYAQIIRSFSRGRGFKNESEWLKQFFFNDDKENDIYENFQRHLSDIDSDLKDHRRNKETLTAVSHKESSLLELKKLKDDKEKKELEYLEAKIYFHYQNAERLKKELIENQNSLIDTNYSITVLSIIITRLELEGMERNNEETRDKLKRLKQLTEELKQAEQNIIEYKRKKQEAEQKFPDLDELYLQVIEVDKWLKKYDDFEKLRIVFTNQSKVRSEQENLKMFGSLLTDKHLHEKFIASDWAVSVERGEIIYKQKMQEYDYELKRLNALKEFADINNKDSIANWVLENTPKLTVEQESVLKHFQNISRKKPEILKEGNKYLPKPEDLFNNLIVTEKEESGFWLNFNGIREYIPYVTEQFFNTNKKDVILNYFRDNFQEAKTKIISLEKERKEWESLAEIIEQVGKDVVSLYSRKQEIENFSIEGSLDKTKEQFENQLNNYYYQAEIKQIKEALKILVGLNAESEQILKDSSKYIDDLKIYLQKNNRIVNDNIESINQELIRLEITQKHEVTYINQKIKKLELFLSKFPKEYENKITEAIATNESHIIKELARKRQHKQSLKHKIIDFNKDIESENKLYDTAQLHYETKTGKLLELITSDYNYILENPEVKENTNMMLALQLYKNKYQAIVNEFIENQNHYLFQNSEDFISLSKAMLPDVLAYKIINDDSVVLDEIKKYLSELTEKHVELSERKFNLLKEIFYEVRDAYDEYIVTIRSIGNYFHSNDKQISQGYKLNLKDTASEFYPIKWIEDFLATLDNRVKEERMHTELFSTLREKIDLTEMMITAYHQCGGKSKNPDPIDLLNPKRYFDIKFDMVSDDGDLNVGSAGQTYAAVALLCIARLTLVEKTEGGKQHKGLRIMPIDEAEGIGSNYGLLEKIAANNDYQIITMSIRPLDDFKEGEQYLYMLNGKTVKNDRISTFAIFSEVAGAEIYTND